METCIITTVNNVNILATNDAKKLVPIKPICEAIGVDHDSQRKKIRNHPILSRVATLQKMPGKDMKLYDMLCLPLQFVFGWLFTIHPDNVLPNAKDSVTDLQMECYQALCYYITERLN